MSSPALIRSLKLVFDRYPLLAISVYTVFSIVGIYIFADCLGDYLYYSREKPRTVHIDAISTLDLKGRPPLASLTGIEWQCSHEIATESDKVVPITSHEEESKNLVLYLPPPNFEGCMYHHYESSVTGTIARIHPRYFQYLQSIHLDLLDSRDQSTTYTLCGYCGANDSLIGLGLSGAFSLIVVSALLLYTRKYFASK